MLSALDAMAGDGAALVSVSFDTGEMAPRDGALTSAARITRATRTLVFVEGEVRDANGRLTVAASAVYRLPAA